MGPNAFSYTKLSTEKRIRPLRPHVPVSPGELLEEELATRGWTQRDLALVLARPLQAINEIIVGKKAITPETAVSLSHAFGTSADYWLGLEARYRLDLLGAKDAKRKGEIERRSRLFSKAPIAELIKRGWINADLSDLSGTERALCEFLRIESIDEEPDAPFSARKTFREEPHTSAQVAWACRVRNLAEKMRVSKYASNKLKELVHELPARSTSEEHTRSVPAALADVGVRLLFVEHLPGTRIDGGALQVADGPAIALSLRYDRVDWFWFTLMHELAHVLADEDSLDQQLVGNDAARTDVSESERRADNRAAGWLIPQEQLTHFALATRPYFSRAKILAFAGRIRVHPGIVVGQLQRRGEIPYSHHRNLLTRVRDLFSETC